MRCAAIVPAYNENPRIRAVVEALSGARLVDDVIVVDDGSSVPLGEALVGVPKVRCLRHAQNRGKAEAMDTGVAATNAEYLFFCDADLAGFASEDADALIGPVTSGTYRMSVGLRANPEQQAVYWFAINSGERCLPRADWLSLPDFYKKGFRMEAGLNMRAWMRGDRVLHRTMGYRNTLRERKYGFWEGSRSRIELSVDVGLSWCHALLFGSK